jgi:peptidoglycan/LPS O-acetylase OafA/YrhL
MSSSSCREESSIDLRLAVRRRSPPSQIGKGYDYAAPAKDRHVANRWKSLLALFAPPEAGRTVEHLHVIDLGRGLAALVVLIWHYQHFYFPAAGVKLPPAARPMEPLYWLLNPFYEHGAYAVQFFWLLSGFVFCAVYVGQKATTREFVVNRFARLYPLHLLTLMVVLLLQLTSAGLVGHEQIYPNNDAYHFALNLLFASFWGLEAGYSFNGPIWSVSVEVAIYAAFWLTLPFLYRRGVLGPALLALVGWLLAFKLFTPGVHFWTCGFYFFAGSVAYIVFDRFRGRPWLMVGAALALLAFGLFVNLEHEYRLASIGMPSLIMGLLLLLCGSEALGLGTIAARARWIGDNTYGVYLWHVPVQIAALIVIDAWVGNRAVVSQPWFLLAFVALVMLIARFSFIIFEKPARSTIRRFAEPGETAQTSTALTA